MTSVPIYLTTKFFYRLQEFLEHWYWGGFKIFSHFSISVLERLDKIFALRINLRYIFRPLYQDRSVLGYILGFFFRSGRIIAAGVIYLVVVAVTLLAYLSWCALLPYLVWQWAASYNLISPLWP